MNNTWLVTQREYLTRVKKKSFVIMTILGPVLIAGFYAALIFLAINNRKNQEEKVVAIADYSGALTSQPEDEDNWHFIKADTAVAADSLKLEKPLYAILIIPKEFSIDKPVGLQLKSKKSISISQQSYLEKKIKESIRNQKLERSGIRKATLDSLNTAISIQSVVQTGDGIVNSNTVVNSAIGMIGSFAIYIFIFIYGIQVMKGVLEEKTNRIVEVIISSVKPFQLMMGKILGVAMVGLTQLFIWIILSAVLMAVISAIAGPEFVTGAKEASSAAKGAPDLSNSSEILAGIFSLNLPLIILSFVFYFITGFLLYSALFASIAAAIDNETDNQQFMLPVTLPLVFAITVAMTTVTNDPHGSLAKWFSMIPLTSPIVMMVRIPFNVPISELLLSMFFMILGFLITTWLAARIYRIGILMYGKKAGYRELWKWIRYKT